MKPAVRKGRRASAQHDRGRRPLRSQTLWCGTWPVKTPPILLTRRLPHCPAPQARVDQHVSRDDGRPVFRANCVERKVHSASRTAERRSTKGEVTWSSELVAPDADFPAPSRVERRGRRTRQLWTGRGDPRSRLPYGGGVLISRPRHRADALTHGTALRQTKRTSTLARARQTPVGVRYGLGKYAVRFHAEARTGPLQSDGGLPVESRTRGRRSHLRTVCVPAELGGVACGDPMGVVGCDDGK